MKKTAVLLLLAALAVGGWIIFRPPPAPPAKTAATTTNEPPPAGGESPWFLRSGSKPRGSAPAPTPVANTSPAPPPGPRILSPQAKAIADMKTGIPRPEQIRSLSDLDRDALTDIYQQTTNLADRTALTWALGLAGNEQTVDLFKNSLTNEFKGRQLTSGKGEPNNEEAVLFDTVKNLGLLAAKYDSAKDFLIQAADPEFWKNNATWNTAGGNNTIGLLTLYSIMALAQSGRDDVPDLLNTLAGRELLNLTPKNVAGGMTFEGSMVQSVYFDYYIKTYGLEKFQDDFIKQRQGTHWFEWAATEEGKQWQAWAGEMARKRLEAP